MIGTRRTTVNGVLFAMERKGPFTHQRSKIIIPARKNLEKPPAIPIRSFAGRSFSSIGELPAGGKPETCKSHAPIYWRE
jgi:hypothetical protein